MNHYSVVVKIGIPARRGGPDAAACTSYALLALFLFRHLWASPGGTMLADNRQDQIFFEWTLTHAARTFTHGDSPFFTHELNAPLGVNLMANTSILGLAIPLSPITLLFGAAATFVVISTLALAATAAAWYYLLSRDVVLSRGAAWVGALFAGFGPAMISQSTGHPNIAAQFVLPFIVHHVIHLRNDARPYKRGITLGLLIVLQCFLNEEVLFLGVLAFGVFLLVRLPGRELGPSARAVLPGLGVAALVAGALLAYPLWHQFAGPQAYHGLPDWVLDFNTDIAAIKDLSRRSIFGNAALTGKLADATEENTFFGWPMLLLMVLGAVVLGRNRTVRGAFVTALIFLVLSLGRTVRYDGKATSVKGPWNLLADLPLFDSVVPTRLALVITPLFGVILAVLLDQMVFAPREDGPGLGVPGRVVWSVAAVAALFPLIPTPHPSTDRDYVPVFFTSGTWRSHLPADATVVPVPGGWWEYLEAMEWSTTANLDFRIVGGYFLGPNPYSPTGEAAYGPAAPPTMQLLGDVSNNGTVPQVSPDQVAQAKADVAYWHATTLVLSERHPNTDQLRQTVDELFGPGEHVDDVWVWDVRSAATTRR
jgi:hypothetical protein